mgnify:CR=1 FL=1
MIDSAKYVLEPDMHRPRLASTGYTLPVIPVGGNVAIAFDAGFGPAWSDVPEDLGQAVKMLAALYYENRGTFGGDTAMPAGVDGLIARYRPVRLFGGGTL